MSIVKKSIFIFMISFTIFANDIDAEIIANLDFYENMDLLEGDEDKIDLLQDENYEKKINELNDN